MRAKMFEAALGIVAPWAVQGVKFDEWRKTCRTSCWRTRSFFKNLVPASAVRRLMRSRDPVTPIMKELRFAWQRKVWRVAFAFDPRREAILLTGGDKGGANERRFYKRLIATANRRFDEHLAALKTAVRKR